MKIQIYTTTHSKRTKKGSTTEHYVKLEIDGILLETQCVGASIARSVAVRLAKSLGLDSSEIKHD